MKETSSRALPEQLFDGTGLDRRTRRTREALMRALIALLQEKPLTAITVTELTTLADVNRATFYTHYQDIFDMYEHLQDYLCQTCRAMVDTRGEELAHGQYRGLIGDIYHYLDENEEISNIVFSKDGDNSFFTAILAVIREACMRNADVFNTISGQLKARGLVGPDVEQARQTVCNYQFDFIAGGAVSVLQGWILGGRKESVELMIAVTNNSIKSLNPDGDYRKVAAVAEQLLPKQAE